jgi:hypothetical protein
MQRNPTVNGALEPAEELMGHDPPEGVSAADGLGGEGDRDLANLLESGEADLRSWSAAGPGSAGRCYVS